VLTKENERLRAKVDAMQHVVNCASVFNGLDDDDDGQDSEMEYEARLAMMDAIKAYRATIAQGSGQ
jgi:hypothetical protein